MQEDVKTLGLWGPRKDPSEADNGSWVSTGSDLSEEAVNIQVNEEECQAGNSWVEGRLVTRNNGSQW